MTNLTKFKFHFWANFKFKCQVNLIILNANQFREIKLPI